MFYYKQRNTVDKSVFVMYNERIGIFTEKEIYYYA